MTFRPTGQEVYQFVDRDSVDTSQIQIYTHTVNNALYINLTYINPAQQEWFEDIIDQDIMFLYQNGQQVAAALILAPLDAVNGYRIQEAPNLIIGQIYEIAFSRPPPAGSVDDIRGEKGWSPVLDYEVYEGGIVFKYIDWLAGEGTRPQLGYLSPNGLVSDISKATKFNLPAGTKWTSGNAFPTSDQKTNDFHLFSEAVSSGLTNYYEANGTTAKTAAAAGDVARFDGDKWIYVMTLSAGGTAMGGTNPFESTIDLGSYENANGGAISGHFVRISPTRVDISHTNIANENKATQLSAILDGQGLKFGNKIFVVEWTNDQASSISFNGFWVGGNADTTAESARINIGVIEHELRMIRFITKEQVYKLIPDLQRAIDKTVDIHLEENPGDFANLNDASVAGISLILNNTANRAALDGRTYNYAGLTWQNTTVDIPDDGQDYWVVVRVALGLGHIESQFQLINDDPLEGTEHLRRSRQEDTNWRYYQVTADSESIWTLQRRAATHTNWLGRIGTAALTQVQGLIDTAINGIRSLLLPDPSGSTAGYVPKVNAARDGYELAADNEGSGGGGGGLTTNQVTTIANQRAAARYTDPEKTKLANSAGFTRAQVEAIADTQAAERFTDEEKTKLTNAIVESDLDPYGLGFIGIYPRYMRFDQLDDNIIIAFGEIHEPYDQANRIEINFNGVQVVRNEFSPTTRFFRFGIESVNATNIKNNTALTKIHWDVQITFFKDGFLDNQVIGNIRTIPVIINRELKPPDITAIQAQLSRAANWADIPNDTDIPANYLIKHSGAYFGAKVAHTKTSSHVAPAGDPTNWIALSGIDASNLATKAELSDAQKAVFAELAINENIAIPQVASTATPLTYAASLPEEHNSSGFIGRASAGNEIEVKAGAYRFDVDMNVDTETSGENARTNVEFTVYNGSTLLKTKRGGYLRSLNVFNEQVASVRFTLPFASDASIQIRVKMHDNDTGTPTIETQAGGSVTVTRIGA